MLITIHKKKVSYTKYKTKGMISKDFLSDFLAFHLNNGQSVVFDILVKCLIVNYLRSYLQNKVKTMKQ